MLPSKLTLFQATLTIAIDDFLAIAAQCAPSIITTKPKFHFLVHIPFFIRRFGPAILYSTERYESFNSVFRLASIFSNRQAPSRDICNSFAAQDMMKHVATGGYWWSDAAKGWVRAGPEVTRLLEKYPDQARLLGLKPDSTPIPGMYVRLSSIDDTDHIPGDVELPPGTRCHKIPAIIWTNTLASSIAEQLLPSNILLRSCVSIVTRSGDIATLGSTVLVRNVASSAHPFVFARLQEVLALDSKAKVAYNTTVQLFEVGEAVHDVYDAPRIALRPDLVLVSPKVRD